jgi:hypothetical protein
VEASKRDAAVRLRRTASKCAKSNGAGALRRGRAAAVREKIHARAGRGRNIVRSEGPMSDAIEIYGKST